MKYYRRNPGDYLSATGHLTLVEHGAYNVLIDTYYAEVQKMGGRRWDTSSLVARLDR